MHHSESPPEQVFLAVKNLEKRFGCSRHSIYRWKREGDFPKAFKLGGSMTRWRLGDIDECESRLQIRFATQFDCAPTIQLSQP